MSTAIPTEQASEILRPGVSSLWNLSWPIIVSRASQVVVGLADAVMVARLGEAALAATTTGAFNIWNLLILPMGTVFIVSSYASQSFGANDRVAARRYGVYGLGVAACALVLAVLCYPWLGGALAYFDYAPDVHALMTSYMQVRLLSTGMAVGLEALGCYYAGVGNTRLPMLTNLLAMGLNVVANYVLIFGKLGAPALGVVGAAWASVIATGIAFLALLGCFIVGYGAPGGRAVGRLSAAEGLRMLRFGVPTGLNWFFEFLAFSFFVNVVMAGFGTTALAALMAVLQLNSGAFMPAFGLASGGAVLVGQAIGAKRLDDARSAVSLTTKAAVLWQGTVGVSFIALPGLWLLPFHDGSADAANFVMIGTRFLVLSAAWQLFDAVATSLSECLRAAGDTAFPLWARMFVAWVVFAPGVYVSVRILDAGDAVAMLWVVGYLALLALLLVFRFRGGAWKHMQLFASTT